MRPSRSFCELPVTDRTYGFPHHSHYSRLRDHSPIALLIVGRNRTRHQIPCLAAFSFSRLGRLGHSPCVSIHSCRCSLAHWFSHRSNRDIRRDNHHQIEGCFLWSCTDATHIQVRCRRRAYCLEIAWIRALPPSGTLSLDVLTLRSHLASRAALAPSQDCDSVLASVALGLQPQAYLLRVASRGSCGARF